MDLTGWASDVRQTECAFKKLFQLKRRGFAVGLALSPDYLKQVSSSEGQVVLGVYYIELLKHRRLSPAPTAPPTSFSTHPTRDSDCQIKCDSCVVPPSFNASPPTKNSRTTPPSPSHLHRMSSSGSTSPITKAEVLAHQVRRTSCSACHGSKFTVCEPHVALPYPLIPNCVGPEQPRSADVTAPFTIATCDDCGLIFVQDFINPELLYKAFHNDAVGALWEEHYGAFAALIAAHWDSRPKGIDSRLAEVGAGQGKLARHLLRLCGGALEVIDPQYTGPAEGVVVHPHLFGVDATAGLDGKLDGLVSSHTLEHFVDFSDYFAAARRVLKPGGLLFTSVPNQEYGFAKAHGSMLSFEHPSACTNLHWVGLHSRFGFAVREVRLFHEHSIMIACEMLAAPVAPFVVDARGITHALVRDYSRAVELRTQSILAAADSEKTNWLFGAHNNAQVIFMYGGALMETLFEGLLDNSPLKQGKRLYGTGLIVRKPSDVLGPSAPPSAPGAKPLRIFVNIGMYNAEVCRQLRLLDAAVELHVL